jgi:hypothetical protein
MTAALVLILAVCLVLRYLDIEPPDRPNMEKA